MYTAYNDWSIYLEKHGYGLKNLVREDGDIYIVEVNNLHLKQNLFCSITRNPSYYENITKVLSMVQHKNILKMYDCFAEGQYYFIIHESYSTKSLEQVCPRPKQEVCMYSLQIINAIEALHTNGIFLANLCPSNIYFDRYGLIKVVDFKNASLIPKRFSTTFDILTKRPAPELIQNTPYNPKAVDFWNFGVILFFLVNGVYPLKEFKDWESYQNDIKDCHRTLAVNEQMPYQELLINLFQIDPFLRPKIEEINKKFGLVRVYLPVGQTAMNKSQPILSVNQRRPKTRPITMNYADVKSYYRSI